MTVFSGPPLDSERGIGPLTIGGLLTEAARRHTSREAIVAWDEAGNARTTWSYERLEREARSVARSLLGSGLVKGGRVALLMGNRPEWVACAMGVALGGGVLVPINTFFEGPELRYVLRHSDASLLLYQAELAGHDYRVLVEPLYRPGGSDKLPYLRRAVCLGDESWDSFQAAGTRVSEDQLASCGEEISPHDDALVVYTSGTTAQPKGVLHTHRPPALQSWRFAVQLGLDEDVRAWSAFPFFWTAGFCMVMGATLAAGGCLVLQEHFEAGEALRLLEVERVTSPHAWPHQLAAMEDHPDWTSRDLSSLCHVDPATAFARHPSVKRRGTWSPRAAYGLTETFTIISSLPADTPLEERGGAQGAILPGNLVRIIDPDSGEPCRAGGLGEISVKGPTLMRGYLKSAPESCFDEDGYFRTGDAGFVDGAGMLHWTGRITDMIKTGGANVSPVEIEEAVLSHPGLALARAVGVPHPTLGELVVLCAVVHGVTPVDEENVRSFLRGRIASYKIPKRVIFFEKSDLSVTGNSKIRTEQLRALAAERLSDSIV